MVNRRTDFRSEGLGISEKSARAADAGFTRRCWRGARCAGRGAVIWIFLLTLALPLAARTKDKDKLTYGEGLVVNISLPASEVEQVVQDVTENGIIRGTKEYNKDEFVSGAKAADSSSAFQPWKDPGKIFYKIREQAIDPRNFKDSGDVGTLVVRYVVVPQGRNTLLRIDAVFEEDFRHTVHQSDGSVESNEYKDIREHLDAIELMKRQNVEAAEERAEILAKKQQVARGVIDAPAETSPSSPPSITSTSSSAQPAAQDMDAQTPADANSAADATPPVEQHAEPDVAGQEPPGQTLEEHVKYLRKQVERLVKAPGAPLKSAPFHTASILQSLPTGTEVLIVISTPYWYGVETHDGQHGWMMREELEQP
jgi:hypothetical protein